MNTEQPRPCTKCGVTKDVSEFYARSGKRQGKYYNQCRACWNEATSRNNLLRKYGLTADQHAALLDKQGDVCAICQCPPTSSRYGLHVDHCHETKKVRGLLCQQCNTGLGSFRDQPALLHAAAAYLKVP